VWISAEMVAGAISPATTQMPTPEMAPKTVDTRISINDERFARSLISGSPRRQAIVSVAAITSPPPMAKWETITWVTATRPMSTLPPMATSKIG
jgi:vacuolar-type H+-ATPase catalytic subunit A/Vma1